MSLLQNPHAPVVLVTGASRTQGIGFEVCRQLAQRGMHVVLTAINDVEVQANANLLKSEDLAVVGHALDITRDVDVASVLGFIQEKFGRLDVLINNAVHGYDEDQPTLGVDLNLVRDYLETNLFGAWRMCEACLPLLRKSPRGRIVNVSSESASFAEPKGLHVQETTKPAYCVSKAALNAFTAKFARALEGTNILVNAVCPGWTATRSDWAKMGAQPISAGAASVVWAATLPEGGPTGGFFRNAKPLKW